VRDLPDPNGSSNHSVEACFREARYRCACDGKVKMKKGTNDQAGDKVKRESDGQDDALCGDKERAKLLEVWG